jgi:hypothetical protein
MSQSDLTQSLAPLGSLLAGVALGWLFAGSPEAPEPITPEPAARQNDEAEQEAQAARCREALPSLRERDRLIRVQRALVDAELSEDWR